MTALSQKRLLAVGMVFVALMCYITGASCQSGGVGAGNFSCSCQQLAFEPCTATSTARYRVTFRFNWTEPLPTDRNSARFLKTYLASHSQCSVVWRINRQASEAMRSLALVPVDTAFVHQLRNLLDTRSVRILSSTSAGVAVVSTSDVYLDRNHPVVSSATYMRPSPDWFTGVDSVNLCRGSEWLRTASFRLSPFDAGANLNRAFSDGRPVESRENIMPIEQNSVHLSESFTGFSGDLGVVMFERVQQQERESSGSPCPPCAQTSTCATKSRQFVCPANEEYSSTVPQCAISCSTARERCATEPGCVCVAGYVRQSNSLTAPCVPRSSCWSEGFDLSSVCRVTNAFRPECNRNVEPGYEVCRAWYSPGCPACENIRCRCMNGFQREEGHCRNTTLPEGGLPPISRATCNATLKKEVVGSLQQPCELSCDGRFVCYDRPSNHCVCVEDHLRNGDVCVRRSQCPRTPETPPTTAAATTTAAPTATAAVPSRPASCPLIPGCAEYGKIGTGEGSERCCPACKRFISTCPGQSCLSLFGCLSYGEAPEGRCCRSCIRYRKKIGTGLCGNVICPVGMVCDKSGSQPRCMCRPSCPNRIKPVIGLDGETYDSNCHLLQRSCDTCTHLR